MPSPASCIIIRELHTHWPKTAAQKCLYFIFGKILYGAPLKSLTLCKVNFWPQLFMLTSMGKNYKTHALVLMSLECFWKVMVYKTKIISYFDNKNKIYYSCTIRSQINVFFWHGPDKKKKKHSLVTSNETDVTRIC